MKLLDDKGNPISTEGVDAKVVALVTAALSGITPQLAATLKPIQDGLAPLGELVTKVENLTKNPPAGDDKHKGKPGDKKTEDGDEAPAWAKGLIGRLDALEGGIKGEKENATLRSSAEAYVKKNHPNLKGDLRDIVIDKIVAAKPKDEAGIKGVIESEQRVLKLAGGDAAIKPFSASVEGEGGTTGNADQARAAEAAKLKQLNTILENGRGTPASK